MNKPLLRCAVQEFPMFHRIEGRKTVENLEEFDDAREVVKALSDEYEACERPDYIERAGRSMMTSSTPPTSAAADLRSPASAMA
jgi:tubulin gamma